MNLVWHIIKKDLLRFRWELVIWAVALLCSRMEWGTQVEGFDWGRYLMFITVVAFGVLTMAMIVGVVQEDNLMEPKAHWRTRAIPVTQLFTAKLGLIGFLFIVIPLCWRYDLAVRSGLLRADLVYEPVMTILALALLLAALGACTKNFGQAMLVLFGVVVVTFVLTYLLSLVSLATGRGALIRVTEEKGWLITSSIVVMSLAVLVSQYLVQRLVLTWILLAGGIVGVALIASYWTWNFIN